MSFKFNPFTGNLDIVGAGSSTPETDPVFVASEAANITAGDITNLSNLSGINTGDQDLSGKQDTLVSGTNIKTINGSSVLGSGDLVVSGSGSFSVTETEIDFGSTPQWGKTFTITDGSVSGTSKVTAWASGNIATDRAGNDDEWDMVMYSAQSGTGQFTLTAMAMPGPVLGKRKVYYAIG